MSPEGEAPDLSHRRKGFLLPTAYASPMAQGGGDLRDRFRGALLGTFCGDALGAALEGLTPAGAGDSIGRSTAAAIHPIRR